MNKGQRKTLDALFTRPAPANLKWDKVISLFKALGGEVSLEGGSMVAVKIGNRRAVFHRPHPEKEIGRGRAQHIRRFLENAGISPE